MKSKKEVILVIVDDVIEKRTKEKPLQTLADKLSSEALDFLAEIAEKPGVEEKLLASRIFIKAFL